MSGMSRIRGLYAFAAAKNLFYMGCSWVRKGLEAGLTLGVKLSGAKAHYSRFI